MKKNKKDDIQGRLDAAAWSYAKPDYGEPDAQVPKYNSFINGSEWTRSEFGILLGTCKTIKEFAYKGHLLIYHFTEFDATCAPLLCDDCIELWKDWANEVLISAT